MISQFRSSPFLRINRLRIPVHLFSTANHRFNFNFNLLTTTEIGKPHPTIASGSRFFIVLDSVSYTHLDVYKRQCSGRVRVHRRDQWCFTVLEREWRGCFPALCDKIACQMVAYSNRALWVCGLFCGCHYPIGEFGCAVDVWIYFQLRLQNISQWIIVTFGYRIGYRNSVTFFFLCSQTSFVVACCMGVLAHDAIHMIPSMLSLFWFLNPLERSK